MAPADRDWVLAYTRGPLTVRLSSQWPFDIETLNAEGEVVFVRRLPAHSTRHTTPEEALAAKGLEPSCGEANRRALADEIVRAAAPQLAEALQGLLRMSEEQNNALKSLIELVTALGRSAVTVEQVTASMTDHSELPEVRVAESALRLAALVRPPL